MRIRDSASTDCTGSARTRHGNGAELVRDDSPDRHEPGRPFLWDSRTGRYTVLPERRAACLCRVRAVSVQSVLTLFKQPRLALDALFFEQRQELLGLGDLEQARRDVGLLAELRNFAEHRQILIRDL
ncbi:MAG: hypothetical protein JWM41_2572 [Gemmatimonadetes bacterium]|nr:hypothetical protein [Gemmatimonadota bacterium]